MTEVGNGLNSKGGFLGSELKDRGDRIAFLGDAHVAQMTALVAFGNYEMLNNSNYYTATIGNSIQPYWVRAFAVQLAMLVRVARFHSRMVFDVPRTVAASGSRSHTSHSAAGAPALPSLSGNDVAQLEQPTPQQGHVGQFSARLLRPHG